jgi:hypothetical protein
VTLAAPSQNACPPPLDRVPNPAQLARAVVESEVLVETTQHQRQVMLLLAFQPMLMRA